MKQRQTHIHVSIHIAMYHLSGLFFPLSKQLQSLSLDIIDAGTLASNVIAVLQGRRTNADSAFEHLCRKISSLCESLDITIQPRRRVGQQPMRDNHGAETPQDFF